MKKIFSLLLLYSCTVSAQLDSNWIRLESLPKLDSAALEHLVRPDSTAIGKPMGSYSGEEIGPEGGRIESADGKVELIFPAGALSKMTSISIQAAQNVLDSTKKAYQFEPSGTQFNKPVKIIFHYSDEEAEECPPELKSFALQDHNGRWSYLEYEDWDSIGKTLSGFIQHFSLVITDRNDVDLIARRKWDLVDDLISFHLYYKPYMDKGMGAWIGLNENDAQFANSKIGVFVNGKLRGNKIEGTGDWRTIDGGYFCYYNAPKLLPPINPVEFKVAFQYYSIKKKKPVWGSIKRWITVYDAYNIAVDLEFPSRLDGKLSDHGTFLVLVSKSLLVIKDIENFAPVVLKNGRYAPFEEKLSTDANSKGRIELSNKIEIPRDINSRLQFPKEVYFDFLPQEVMLFNFSDHARGLPWSKVTPLEGESKDVNIWFVTNGQTQRTHTGSSVEDVKVTIVPFRPRDFWSYKDSWLHENSRTYSVNSK